MKKAILFTLVLSLAGCFMIGCKSDDDGGAENSVNKAATTQADASKPPSATNPGGAQTASPL